MNLFKDQRGDSCIELIAFLMIATGAIFLIIGIPTTDVETTTKTDIEKEYITKCEDMVCIKKCESIPDEKIKELKECMEHFSYEQCTGLEEKTKY